MTPKEKANELVDKFYTIDEDSEMFDGFTMPIFYAQRCALIAVDEIMEVCYYTREVEFNDFFSYDYWQEVKQEIEAL